MITSIDKLTIHLVVVVVGFGDFSTRIHVNDKPISSVAQSRNIDPLTIEMPTIGIGAIDRYSLRTAVAVIVIPRHRSLIEAVRVFEAKTRLVTFHLMITLQIDNVIQSKFFKRMIVLVTLMPLPVGSIGMRLERCTPQVENASGEAQNTSI